MALSDEWLKIALTITGDFETSGDPFNQVTGNFDGQGISCGVLQWNIKQGSLQPLVKAGGKALVDQMMPKFGDELWEACTANVSRGMEIVTSARWQAGAKVKAEVKAELQNYLGSQQMQDIQVRFSRSIGEKAFMLAAEWARDDSSAAVPTLREFCFFFDVVTQSGGMKGVWLDDVKNFKEAYAPDRGDDAICDWLEAIPGSLPAAKDSHKNAALWRDRIADDRLDLFILGYLRAMKSNPPFRAVAFNRRGTIAATAGFVNGEKVELPQLR